MRLPGLVSALALSAALAAPASWVRAAEPLPGVAQASNVELIAHDDLKGYGAGGEGLALKQYANGQRVLFIAHVASPMCLSMVDVTAPDRPRVLQQLPAPKGLQCNSLGLAGDLMTVAKQSDAVGDAQAGLDIYDVSSPSPRLISHFDTSGPSSRGVHFVWFVDGRYAYLATGAKDFTPIQKGDDQFLMIVDLKNPAKPVEVGRWWMPGTRVGDTAPPPARLSIDSGFRMHSAIVLPEQPDRAYLSWIDGGHMIMDIADKARPKLISHQTWGSFDVGFNHTLLPIPSRKLMIQTEEAVRNNCKDWPKRNWVWDASDERRPIPLSVLPPPGDLSARCKDVGRFGAHNVHMNRPTATSRTLTQTVVGSYFNGGMRIHSIRDPSRPEEIGYLMPKVPAGTESSINDVYVDENGIIYATDRLKGGLYVMRYTGPTPLE